MRPISVTCLNDVIAISPGTEVSALAFCLVIFARGVLDPDGSDAALAQGTIAYAATDWSRDIARATGVT